MDGKVKNCKYLFLGLIFLFVSLVLMFTDFLDHFLRPIIWLLLMGSSKGKDIIFFGLIGLFFILLWAFSSRIKNFPKSKDFYLKMSLFLTLISVVIALSSEIIIRLHLGVNIFTVFTIPSPNFTTTSLLHSHVFKSVFGNLAGSIVPNNLHGIHTAKPIMEYLPWISNLILIILPVLFFTLFLSLKNRLLPSRLLLIFSSALTLIGIVDGNLFANPTIIGIYGLLIVFCDENYLDYLFGAIFKNKKILDCFYIRREEYRLKRKKSAFKAYFKRALPHLILVLLMLSHIGLSIIGTNQEYYEADLIGADINNLNSSLTDISVKSISYEDNKVKILINPDYNDEYLLNNLANDLSNKCKAFSLSWNVYSEGYF
jgi:hypothetical protein